jgi:hypothetical protein
MKSTYRLAGVGVLMAVSVPACPATAMSWQDVPVAIEAANRIHPHTSTSNQFDQ